MTKVRYTETWGTETRYPNDSSDPLARLAQIGQGPVNAVNASYYDSPTANTQTPPPTHDRLAQIAVQLGQIDSAAGLQPPQQHD